MKKFFCDFAVEVEAENANVAMDIVCDALLKIRDIDIVCISAKPIKEKVQKKIPRQDVIGG